MNEPPSEQPPPAQTPTLTPNFDAGVNGLLPAIAQDVDTSRVLMMAWMNAEAWAETLQTGQATYFSRSRGKLWRKGETSGHRQAVREIRVDCDADTILLMVQQTGAACHEGYASCFFRTVGPDGATQINESRLVDPDKIYSNK